MTDKVTVTAKVWGVRSTMPETNLGKFLDELDHVYYSIPAEFRSSAEIDFEPSCEYGEYYNQVTVTYERDETPEETTKRLDDERKHWGSQLNAARDRVAYCEAQIAVLPTLRRV